MTLDRSTVTRLETLNLVRRVRDGRNTWVRVRPTGSQLLPAIHAAWKDLYRSYCHVLGEHEANVLNELIAQTVRGCES